VIHLRTPTSPDGEAAAAHRVADEWRIDARIAESWSTHPRRFFVDATPDFLTKAAQALGILRDLVPPCCRHHVKPFLWATWPGDSDPHGP
jgi:hypothetical protein